MRFTTTLSFLFALLLLLGLCVEAPSAPAPDEIETARDKLVALKKKLPEVVKACLDNATLWPRKYKGKITTLRLVSPNEAKLTIRLEYVPPDPTDTPAGAAGGGPAGGGGPGGGRRVRGQGTNEVVFISLKLFDGAWTTNQVGPTNDSLLVNGINNLMAAIDEIADREAGK